jgi:hypothetical protein
LVWDTYPEVTQTLRLRFPESEETHYIFVGSNWIGDGRGIVRLADIPASQVTYLVEEAL